jgi:hypothetical protein
MTIVKVTGENGGNNTAGSFDNSILGPGKNNKL